MNNLITVRQHFEIIKTVNTRHVYLFKSKLGITLDNKDVLVEALIKIAKDDDYIFTQNSQYRQKYVIDFDLTTPKGTSKIRSAWIIRFEEDYPRLTTVYPLD